MDEGTGFNVSVGIDMTVAPATGNAAANIFTVIPEINRKYWLRLTVLTDLVIHHLTLLSRSHQFRYRSFSNRHIGEEPCKFSAQFDHIIKIFFAANHFWSIACISAGNSKGKFFLFKIDMAFKIFHMFPHRVFHLSPLQILQCC